MRGAMLGLALLVSGATCTVSSPPSVPVTPTRPARLCVGGVTSACRTPREVSERLAAAPIRVLRADPLPHGTQGGRILSLETRDGVVFGAKWRAWSMGSRSNAPVLEAAAAELQEMALDPHDYVVPPAEVRCLPSSVIRAIDADDAEPYSDTHCALSVLTYWLAGSIGLREAQRRGLLPDPPRDVSGDPELFSRERFDRDPRYRRNLANLNVMLYLTANGDAHAGQFVLYPEPLHVFAVDHSVAFGLDHRSAMRGRQDLSTLLVPAIPASTAARIRALRKPHIERLAVLASFEERGTRLVRTDPGAPIGDRDASLRTVGPHVQVGLTSSEVAVVQRRLRELQRRLETGELGTFP